MDGMLNTTLAQVDKRTQQHLEPIHKAITALTTQTEQSSQQLTQVDERTQQHLESIHKATTALTTRTEQSSQLLAQVDERIQQHLEPIHKATTALTTRTEQSSQLLAQVDERTQHLERIHEAITALTTKIEQLSLQQARFQRLDDAAVSLVFFRKRRKQAVTAQGGKKSRDVARNPGRLRAGRLGGTREIQSVT